MDEFMDEFMDAMKEVFPNLLVQFEDFSTDNAFKYLDRFREKYRCFNDDVSLSGYAAVLIPCLQWSVLADPRHRLSCAVGFPQRSKSCVAGFWQAAY